LKRSAARSRNRLDRSSATITILLYSPSRVLTDSVSWDPEWPWFDYFRDPGQGRQEETRADRCGPNREPMTPTGVKSNIVMNGYQKRPASDASPLGRPAMEAAVAECGIYTLGMRTVRNRIL
jgi:hypothetical protein